MALSFFKKVFTFGKDKPAQAEPAATPAVDTVMDLAESAFSPAETRAIEAELEPHSRTENLPLAEDPVLSEEMDTAGGPSADLEEDGSTALTQEEQEEETFAILPATEQIGDLGLIPLSLLEAEAEAEDAPDSAQDVAGFSPITDEPLEEVTTPVLPKGFATGPTLEPEPVAPTQKLTWYQRLRQGLARTSSQLTGQITALFTKRKLDEDTLQDLEDLLIQADLGLETALRITDALSAERYGKDVSGEDVTRIMAAEITKVLGPVAKPLQLDLSHKPHVILVVGVNGTGKTTTIGKLAAKLSGAGLKVMLAAGDTFRAAAIEQLNIWAERTKSDIVSSRLGADAAGLAYEAFEQARLKKSDVLIIDTAGRLQNKTELMAELEKIVRVLGKLDPDAPHTVLQTLDATTGQNALNQVEIFRNVAGVNGLIMTKLDGTARGGILVAISAKHKLPVYFIGVGEGIDDLEPFEAKDFAEAIAGLDH
ncbi:signal recognition particle-docking protein FtsY [Pararhizobium antarcticum]|uniref:Signal recognition particle receptor FtsY n=1 Tax=Pararhizobium antarcticum TaxID=1798805 RepID=A0A657LW28_9HYPH|nr:signal recognition particle-docking protein FtsY [Pararhizobium antarcticum]OJF89819.1 signal recognition particle-docking protein FtsY [Rhizobium sp. 58]OJF99768.1 signal recognition particle-docking protein FtsY [Pararhizobium antarcticum]